MLLLGLALAYAPFLFAQSVDLGIPSLTEEGLASLLSSQVLLNIILVILALAGAAVISYLICNLRMALDESKEKGIYAPRYPSPSDPFRPISTSHKRLNRWAPQLVAVDHEREEEEEDPRGESNVQRG